MQPHQPLILLLPYLLPSLAAPPPTEPLTLLAPNSTPAFLKLPTSEAQTATRDVPNHDCFLNITYYPSDPLPFPLYTRVLSTAQFQTTAYHSDGDVVDEPYAYHEQECYFSAESYPYMPTKRLTYGILAETVAVLTDFMLERPYALRAAVFEDVETRSGPPIGVVFIDSFAAREAEEVGDWVSMTE